ncbi:MAG: S49 family peptidase, partial [Woeseiaceae bacterium]
KEAVSKYRPALDLQKVATGEHWYGTRALDLGLVDELKTSDELLAELAAGHDLYGVEYKIRQPLPKRLLANVDGVLEKVDAATWRRRFESRLPR